MSWVTGGELGLAGQENWDWVWEGGETGIGEQRSGLGQVAQRGTLGLTWQEDWD